MIPQQQPDFPEVMRRSKAACDALGEADGRLKREVLAHAGNRWSLGVVYALGVESPLRHAALGRRLDGVTQRMLTRTLRHLERDGLIRRTDYREVPPRVEYSLTDLGRGLLIGMVPLWSWVIDNAEGFHRARVTYDRRAGPAEGGDVSSSAGPSEAPEPSRTGDRTSRPPA